MKKVLFILLIFLASCEKEQNISTNNNCQTQIEISKANYLGTWYFDLNDGSGTQWPVRIEDSFQDNSVHVYFPFHTQDFYFIGVNSEQWRTINFPHEILYGTYAPEQGLVLSGNMSLIQDKLSIDIITVEFNSIDLNYNGDTTYFQHICHR